MASQRQKIIDTVFAKRSAAGGPDEIYVSHVKIWEDAGTEGRKPRYILLSKDKNGGGFLHKSKLNSNGTFSVGKTWRLTELRAIHVVNPLAFNLTLSRTYRWQTEDSKNQLEFLDALVQLFRNMNPGGLLKLDGFIPADNGRESQSDDLPAARIPPPLALMPGHTKQSYNVYQSKLTPEADSDLTGHFHVASQRTTSPSRTGFLNVDNNHDPGLNDLPASFAQCFLAPSPPSLENPVSTEVSFDAITRPPALSCVISAPPSFSLRGLARQGFSDIRREQHSRVIYFDVANQAKIDRLLSFNLDIDPRVDGDDETAAITMSSVEEMIEGYEWASDDVITRKSSTGAADMIEARLLDELSALEKANIHSFLESDDRISIVLRHLDESISQLDSMDSFVSSYKIHLNSVSEDIQWIQSQNRGLQVQTQNQRELLHELQNLLKTVNVDQQALVTLTHDSLEKPKSIERIEEAATELYKALQAGHDTEMAATMERLDEYRTHNRQFCKRLVDFLSIMFKAQSKTLLDENHPLVLTGKHKELVLTSHEKMEAHLGRYSGLVLYLKEMDEDFYAKVCASYFLAVSTLHGNQIKSLLLEHFGQVKKLIDQQYEHAFSFIPVTSAPKNGAGIRRAGNPIWPPLDGRQKDMGRISDGYPKVSEALKSILEQLALAINHEEEFITDFLHINNAGLTFADYMGLDNYFRRQAQRASGLSPRTTKFLRGAIDLIFGFLPMEMKSWVDSGLESDEIGVYGLISTLERFLIVARQNSNQFLFDTISKQLTRLSHMLDRHVKRQVDDIEQTKLSSKRKPGVAYFVKQFPAYIERVEDQLNNANDLEIRITVNAAYEKIVGSIFDSLKHMANFSGEVEDKSQLNYHITMIENMHHFVSETSSLGIDSMTNFIKQAGTIYDENLNAYVKHAIRRHFTKIIDYFEGVERLLKTTVPDEVSNNSSHSKSALRKVIKEYSSKDVRKQIEAMHTRIGKHFPDASFAVEDNGTADFGAIFTDVWKACEVEILRITELFSKRIFQCYRDTGMTLEYTAGDVEGAFRRYRLGT